VRREIPQRVHVFANLPQREPLREDAPQLAERTLAQHITHAAHDVVVKERVPSHQDAPTRFGVFRERTCCTERKGEWLLHQNITPRVETRPHMRLVQASRRREHHGIR
jgi:hypothetical protein